MFHRLLTLKIQVFDTMRFLPLFFTFYCASSVHAQLVREAAATLNLPATLPVTTGFATENALGTLTFLSPIDVASPPGVTNRLFVLERGVGIQIVNLETMTKSSFMPLAAHTGSESGLLSLAFHPNYNQNGYFYVFYSLQISGLTFQRVARFQATGTVGNYNAATSASATTLAPIITQRDQQDNHNGGDIAFGPDGYLYISTGDEGAQRDGSDNARRIAKDFLGHILRIDVDSKPGSLEPNPHDESSTPGVAGDSAISAGSYRIPPDNPFVTMAQGTGNATYNGYTFPKSAIRTEIYSSGYRNPWRMSFDPFTGRLFVADVGQDKYEEINIVKPKIKLILNRAN
jgi:glucose/arabinose dehydrogenase